jgi:hypothetical protein
VFAIAGKANHQVKHSEHEHGSVVGHIFPDYETYRDWVDSRLELYVWRLFRVFTLTYKGPA